MELALTRPLGRSKRILGPVFASIFIVLALWLSGKFASQHYLTTGYERAEAVMRLTVNALDADLARYQVVPQLIADLDLVQKLIENPGNLELRETTNLWLDDQNQSLGSSDIYLMLSDGETIAASNYNKTLSFIGENFSYRPYWIDAMDGQPARFYGVGTTSGIRGYYFSAPVRDQKGRIGAVIAVKVSVDRLEQAWQGSEYKVIVTDPEGIVFLSTEKGWLYHSLKPLTAARLRRTEESRRYAESSLGELRPVNIEEHGVPIMRLAGASAGGVSKHDYIVASQEMLDAGWTVHVLLANSNLKAEARLAQMSLLLVLAVTIIGALFLRQRRARVTERLAMQQAHTSELENRVVKRTADLARVNARLKDEISERRLTEAALRTAQTSLLQAGKLAALGQMSATLSHELNQPLAAARNYADSAAILIERGDFDRARENISQIMILVDRMAAIAKHLRQAARVPGEQLVPVDLKSLLPETLTIVGPRLSSSDATLNLNVADDLPPLLAGATRLQQVLVNLIVNAADAVEGQPDRQITLTARQVAQDVSICVRDHGPGIPEAIIGRIFDPFFSTKKTGAGLGLGLSITSNIVRDFHGEMTCRNADPGAEFCVRLPISAKDSR